MAFVPESLKRQNEVIRALQAEIDEKQRELENQKWVFEQFLRSPSWRVTAPGRWIVQRLRALKGRRAASPTEAPEAGERIAPRDPHLFDPKSAVVGLYRTALQSFLVSGGRLILPAAAEPEASIIVVLYNRAELAFACLRSIAEHHGGRTEVIVVDNASTDETPLLLNRLDGAHVIRNPENRHFLRAVNQAAKRARGRALVLLNSDAQLLPGSLDAALETLASAPDVGAVGGKLIFFDGALQEAGSGVWRDGSCFGYGRDDVPFAPQYMFRRDVDYCSGAFLATRRALWEQLGGFDEAFSPAYYEETDYCMRLWDRGYRVVYEPDAAALHHEFASSSSIISVIGLQQERQQIFLKRHRRALESHEPSGLDREVWARSPRRGKRALLLDDRVPHQWLGSGFPRAHKLLDAILHEGYFVTFYPLTVTDEDWNEVYRDIPREVEVMNQAGPAMLKLFMKTRQGYYDTLIVSRPHNMEILRPILKDNPEWFEGIRLIYDAEALFADREAGLRRLRGSPMPEAEFQSTLRNEIDLAAKADVVVAVSERDRDALMRHGVRNVSVLGHALEAQMTPAPFDDRTGLLFVGAVHEEDSPNGDSLIWFLTEVYALVRQSLGNDIAFNIAGVNCSERIRRLAAPPARLLGSVPELSGLYAGARIFVAPTRYGAGVPHKIHEAAARGLPVVGTSLLAWQLGWTDREMSIGDTPEAFAMRIVELYKDPVRWEALRQAAFDRAARECSTTAFEAEVHRILKESPSTTQAQAGTQEVAR